MGTTAVKSSKITFLQPPPSSDGLIRPAAAPTPAAAKQAAAAAGSSGKAAAAAAEVLGADNAGELVQQRQSKSSKKRSEPEPDGAQQQQQQDGEEVLANGVEGMETDEEQEALGEPTLGQRVLELEQQQRQQQGGAVQVAAAEAAAGDAAAAAAAIPAGPLKADSLAVLLSQALRSSDRALLERCLSVGRERVITNSVKRLVPMDAALLLKAAVERLQTKPSRGQQLAAWIQAVLLHHTAYLMSAPAAAPLMSSLYQIIEARLAMQRQMLSLAGRLELLLAQRGPEGPAGGAAAAAPVAQVRVRPAQVLGLHCAMCSACLWLQTVYSIAAAAG
jgi:U3 small nucleolar RNA-associated protein 5